MNCIYLMSKRSKQRKTTKVIKLRWIACIWHQNERKCRVRSQTIQNNAKVQKWSKYNDLHRYDVKSDQITMNLDRFDVQTIKNFELRRKPFKTAKLQKWSKYNDFHRFDVKYIKTTQNYKNYQITWIASIWCQNYQNNAKLQKRSNWTSKRAKMLSYVENIQNNAKLQKWSNYDELHAFDIKTNENVALGRNHSKQRQSTKVIKIQWLASIWCRKWSNYDEFGSIWRPNDQKYRVTSQTIQNR